MSFRDRRKEDLVPLEVKVYYSGDSKEKKAEALEKALSRFKKLVAKEGLIDELKEREYYKSPSRKRHEKKRKFLYRNKLNKEKAQRESDKRRHSKRKNSSRNKYA